DLYCTAGNQRVCAREKRCPGAVSHQAMNVLQYRFLGYARNDDGAKRCKNCGEAATAISYF
ncbi:MAG: hypothetical protein MR666_01005, partial [Dialister sp.]|nr:hypothetical protein [Dialister sp.]